MEGRDQVPTSEEPVNDSFSRFEHLIEHVLREFPEGWGGENDETTIEVKERLAKGENILEVFKSLYGNL